EAPAMTQAAIRKVVADSVATALEAQAATMANDDNTNRNIGPREALIARKTAETKGQPLEATAASVSNLSCLWRERKLQKLVPKSKQQCPWKSILAEGEERSPRPKRSHSFDIVIGMDWVSKYHARIIYDEKVVRILIDVFIDDILIYSRNKEEYADHLRIILELLKKEKLYAKFSKCDFWISIVQFLRHVIDSQGIHVDPVKIEAVKD
ncbi:putative reverse transcriptase domain-containing protein, partial [Tanacetum coccineum]